MPSHQKLFVADMDGNGRDDLVTHSPGASAGDCAMRCRECCPCRTAEPPNRRTVVLWETLLRIRLADQQSRFGFPSFDLADADDSTREGRPYCLCGPKFESMKAPT
jgi:hypothetical protein